MIEKSSVMIINKRDNIKFDGTERLSPAQTLAAFHNYALKKMGVSPDDNSPDNIFYYTTAEYEQKFLDSIKDFFKAMGFKKEECMRYMIRHDIGDNKLTPVALYFDKNANVSEIATTSFKKNYGRNAVTNAINDYINEEKNLK